MSETKHTPGPWKAEACPVKPERGKVYVEGPDGWDRSPVCSTRETLDVETDEANARLIAAAPKLLVACERALRFIDGERKGSAILADLLHAAIAKAKGE